MGIYLLNIGLMLIWAYCLKLNVVKGHFHNPRKTFCILAAIQWILISGLRGIMVGADTLAYKVNRFEVTNQTSWYRIWKVFTDVVFRGEEGKDPGYPILEKTFQIFSDNYQIWLIFIAVLFTVSMSVWIYNHSEDVVMSFLIYSCLFYSFFAITGHRQTIATAVVVFICNPLIQKRHFFWFLLITLVMSTIHRSCLVYILYYFLYNKKITKKYVAAIIISMIIGYIFREQMMNFLGEASGYDSYEVLETAGAYTFTALILLVFAVSCWRMKSIIRIYPEAVQSYNAFFLALIFIPLLFVNQNIMRVVQYFSLNLMLMVPYIIKSFKKREQFILNAAIAGIMIFLLVQNNPQYMFFWE